MEKATETKSKKKQTSSKHEYIREIVISYRKKRVPSTSPQGKSIRGAEQLVRLFSDLQNETKEKMIAVSLDTRLKIITFEVVAIGSIKSIYFRPAETLRATIMVNGYGVVILHNHPSGDITPSPEDKIFTKNLLTSANSLGIELHDHIIIGDGAYYSFAEQGML